MDAAAVAGQLLVLLGTFYLPGFLALYGLRLKVFPALALAPAVSAGIAGAASIVCLATGWRWEPASAGLLALAAVLLCFLFGWLTVRRKPPVPADPEKQAGAPLSLKILTGTALAAAAALIGSVMLRGVVSLDRVNQGWDPTFHANAVRWIQDSGQASAWSLVPIFGGAPPSYYPAGWHELVSLVPGDVVTAANLSCLLIGAVIWPTSLAYLATALFPRQPVTWVLAPLFGAAVLAFPFIQLVRSGQWPNGFATAVIPAVLALGINLLYDSRLRWRRPQQPPAPPGPGTAARTAALLAAAAGAIWIHPSALFALLLLGGFYLGRFLILGFLYQWRQGKVRAVVVSALTAAALAGLGLGLSQLPALIRLLDYPRAHNADWPDALAWLYFDLPGRPSPSAPNPGIHGYATTALMVAGAAAALAFRRSRPAVGGMAAATGLFILAAGPENPYRWLAGFWYKDPPRIAPLMFTFGCVFAALAVERICSLAAAVLRSAHPRRRQVLAAALGLLAAGALFTASGGFRDSLRLQAAAAPYLTIDAPRGRALLGDEQEFIRSLGPVLPPDAVVVGDPFNGLPYIYALTGHRVVFPQMINRPGNEDEAYLRRNFRNILTDPEVCRALGRLGATHVYDDGPIRARRTDRHLQWPGFRGVDYSLGFELVARQGTAAIYKITACMPGAQPWTDQPQPGI
ncbi:DUF6541 family protein [Arthrobacter mobilis]|uniref:Uncharacterized protein n=1 Tax=Arthrobacter mobilis TaxID=2724944 RepID=A0A7X6K702_9MICC|nr:DUF6541 family protein [Arthrobacter mobilis]NKX56153.1 hypothetical protein [Arthrobacter mobilis]